MTAIPTHAERIGFSVSNTPGTSSAFTVNAAETVYRAPAAGMDGYVFDVLAIEGTSWEVRRDCVYTHSGTSLARGTLVDSSSGSAINFTSAVKIYEVPTAFRANFWERECRGVIRGLEISYSSTTAIAVAAGVAALNGKLMSYAGATLTSGSTMTNIAGSTVTLGASKCYFVFLYDNSGTAEIRIEERDGTGDGADPTWDSDLDYWKSASTGAAARRVGKFWTNGSNNIIFFDCVHEGSRAVTFRSGVTVLSGGTATSATSVTITPYVTADDAGIVMRGALARSSGTAFLAANLYNDGGTNPLISLAHNNAVSGAAEVRQYVEMPNSGTLHYLISGTNVSLSIIIAGTRFTR